MSEDRYTVRHTYNGRMYYSMRSENAAAYAAERDQPVQLGTEAWRKRLLEAEEQATTRARLTQERLQEQYRRELDQRQALLADAELYRLDRQYPVWAAGWRTHDAQQDDLYRWGAARRAYINGDDGMLERMCSYVTLSNPPLANASLPAPGRSRLAGLALARTISDHALTVILLTFWLAWLAWLALAIAS